MVAAPLAMIRRPVAVDPVKAIMSTMGLPVISSPTSAWPVMTLRTPGGARLLGGLGDQESVQRRPWMGFEHDRAARGQGRGRLHHVEHEGEVERGDGADHADRLTDQCLTRHAGRPAGGSTGLDPLDHVLRLGGVGTEHADGAAALDEIGEESGGAGLGHDQFP